MEIVVALVRVFVRLSRQVKSRVENERHVQGGCGYGDRVGKRCNDRVHGLSEGFYRDQNAPLCKRGFTRWGPTRPRDGDLSR